MADTQDTFATLMHDAKSTLTSIKAYTQILQRRFEKRDDPETQDDLEKLNEKIDALTEILTQTYQEGKHHAK